MDPISALAELVDEKLIQLKQPSPGKETIGEVLRVVYSTSMKKEETEPLKCSVAYMDPSTKNDGTNPSIDCWNAFPLGEPIQYDARNLAKVSRSADPSAVVIAVFPDSAGRLRIWGFVDQVAVHSQRLASWETWHAEGVPGNFYVNVNGVGDLTVFRGLGIIGALKQDTVVRKYDNVMDEGPVANHLYELSSRLAPAVVRQFVDMKPEELRNGLGMHLAAALSRILLHMKCPRLLYQS